MIRTIASCPYCRDGVIALEDRPKIVFNPDATKNAPCAHLSFFWTALSTSYESRIRWNWAWVWQSRLGRIRLNSCGSYRTIRDRPSHDENDREKPRRSASERHQTFPGYRRGDDEGGIQDTPVCIRDRTTAADAVWNSAQTCGFLIPNGPQHV